MLAIALNFLTLSVSLCYHAFMNIHYDLVAQVDRLAATDHPNKHLSHGMAA